MRTPPPVQTHGTYAGYVNGCKDECCRTAAARYKRMVRARKAEEDGVVMATVIDRSWVESAACADVDTGDFYPPEPDKVPSEVRAICSECPVRLQCLSYALHHEDEGVWAATSPAQRRVMRRRDRIRLTRPVFVSIEEREAAGW